MKKFVYLTLCMVLGFMFVTPVLADSGAEKFLKGENADDPLMVSFYIAKSIDIGEAKEGEEGKAIRIKLERKNNIGSFSHAEYTVSAGLEF